MQSIGIGISIGLWQSTPSVSTGDGSGYLRVGGIFTFRRPDGTSVYLRP